MFHFYSLFFKIKSCNDLFHRQISIWAVRKSARFGSGVLHREVGRVSGTGFSSMLFLHNTGRKPSMNNAENRTVKAVLGTRLLSRPEM